MTASRQYDPAQTVARTGLSHDTLRYYEREGLIGPIRRSAAGHRQYDEDDLAWIGIITCLRDAGLGIADLRRFTELLRSPNEPTDRVTFLEHRRTELRQQLRRLQNAIAVLDDKIDYWRQHAPTPPAR